MDSSRRSPQEKLAQAAIDVVRQKGYAATTVDDICAAAGVTKGSFFHHFKSKEQSILAATERWNDFAEKLFAEAAYRNAADPRDRVFGYVDLRIEMMRGDLADITCFLGTLVQETYATSPAIRAACGHGIDLHADVVARDIAAAKTLHAPGADWQPASLARFMQASIQGAFVLAKASGDSDVAADCLRHLRRYLESLLAKAELPNRRRPARTSRSQS